MLGFSRKIIRRRNTKGFQSLNEIWALMAVREFENEADLVKMYHVILRRTKNPNLVGILMDAGFSYIKAVLAAERAKRDHVIISRTYFEHAELLKERIDEYNDEDVVISIVEA